MNNEEHKEFSIGAILSITSGYLLIEDFNDVKECIDFTTGVEYDTDYMSIKDWTNAVKEDIYAQHPDLVVADYSGIDRLDKHERHEKLDELERIFGETRMLVRGYRNLVA